MKNSIIIIISLCFVLILSCDIGFAQGEWSNYTVEEWEEEDQIPGASIIGLDEFNQSPMLDELVEAGEIPPVNERLPKDPIVVNPVDEIGKYGGTMNRVEGAGMVDLSLINKRGYGFAKYDRNTMTYYGPNLALDWEWNEDKSSLTFYLVEGIKWSDGEPLTADDILFWWEDIILDDSLPYRPPSGTHIDGKPMKMIKIDDYTVKFQHEESYPYMLHAIGQIDDQYVRPSHYLKKFHPKYNEELERGEVDELLSLLDSPHEHPELPVHTPWKLVEYKPGERKEFERNPFYWKVDPAGNQLPYIDRIVSRVVDDKEMALLHAFEGNVDFQAMYWPLADIPIIMERQSEGGYRVIFWEQGDQSRPKLYPGYDNPDEEIRNIILDQRFRQALSYGINRERVNEIVFYDFAEPTSGLMTSQWPITKLPEGQEVYEEWENSWIEHNPERANSLLDEMNMIDQNGDGWRERPDGESFELYVDINAEQITAIDAMDIIGDNWAEIGIKTTLNPLSGVALNEKVLSGDYMIYARHSGAGTGFRHAPGGWLPLEHRDGGMHPLAGLYYETDGEKGVPPRTEYFKEMQELYSKAIKSPEETVRNQAEIDAIKLHIEHGPLIICVVGNSDLPVILNKDMKNVVEWAMVESWYWNSPGITNVDHYYFDR